MAHPLIEMVIRENNPDNEELVLEKIAQTELEIFAQIEKAININDKPRVANLVRGLQHWVTPPLPSELINALANYLDPAILKPRGPKPGKTEEQLMLNHLACIKYSCLCESPEWARQRLHKEEKAFHILTTVGSTPKDINWHFGEAPPWKYPELEPIRERRRYPLKGDIKAYILELYSLSSRTFEGLMSKYNRGQQFGMSKYNSWQPIEIIV